MAVLEPKRLTPIEELYCEETIEARKTIFPEGRITSFENATDIIGWDK